MARDFLETGGVPECFDMPLEVCQDFLLSFREIHGCFLPFFTICYNIGEEKAKVKIAVCLSPLREVRICNAREG